MTTKVMPRIWLVSETLSRWDEFKSKCVIHINGQRTSLPWDLACGALFVVDRVDGDAEAAKVVDVVTGDCFDLDFRSFSFYTHENSVVDRDKRLVRETNRVRKRTWKRSL